MREIKYEELKEYLNYDPDSGIFTWIKPPANNVRIGDLAGSLDSKGYIKIQIFGERWLAHRLAWLYMNKEMPIHGIDHINGIPTDNRIENLRDVSQQANTRNSAMPKNNKSGIVGVSWDVKSQHWLSGIRVNYKQIFLGRFDNIFDAACARKSAERQNGFHINHGRTIEVEL